MGDLATRARNPVHRRDLPAAILSVVSHLIDIYWVGCSAGGARLIRWVANTPGQIRGPAGPGAHQGLWLAPKPNTTATRVRTTTGMACHDGHIRAVCRLHHHNLQLAIFP
jgi:hypothetical protein